MNRTIIALHGAFINLVYSAFNTVKLFAMSENWNIDRKCNHFSSVMSTLPV